MIEYLVSLLNESYKIGILSRGYGRNTKGFLLANKSVTYKNLGDEPFQFYNKFGDTISVAVDADRVNGINELLLLKKHPEVILLDDAFQHRKVKAGLNILLTTFNSPFFKAIVLPTGDLREPRDGYKRAKIIIVTKCPTDITVSQKENVIKRIKPKPNQKVFFSSITYAKEVISFTNKLSLTSLGKFTLVTGIANAYSLVKYLKGKKLKFEHLNYKDHYEFKPKDISLFASKTCIITTEKDYMRLMHYKNLQSKLYYLPIKFIVHDTNRFCKTIMRFVNSF